MLGCAMIDTDTIKRSNDVLALAERDTTMHKVTPNEYAGPCPSCGGTDRFRVHTEKGWFCRRCHNDPWQDVIEYVQHYRGLEFKAACEYLNGTELPEAFHLDQEALDAEIERVENYLAELQTKKYWLEYHNNLGDRGRQLWNARGLSELWQDRYQLGLRPEYRLGDFVTDALSIPHFHREQLMQVQYRLNNMPPSGGKYRQTKGLPPALFIGEPDWVLDERVLLVEGAIKSMVLQVAAMGGYDSGHTIYTDRNLDLNVVGIPSKTPSSKILLPIRNAKQVIIGLDPDAHEREGGQASAVQRVIRLLRDLEIPDIKVIQFPDKPDDWLLRLGLGSKWIYDSIHQARAI